jgi:glycosyltransferase involved in cell wall biosynthesis
MTLGFHHELPQNQGHMRIWQYTALEVAGVGGVETHIAEASAALKRLGHESHIGVAPPPFPPDIVHTHGDTWITPLAARNIRARGAATWIQVCHGTSIGRVLACREYFSLSGWRGVLRDFLPLRFADAAVAVSAAALDEAQTYFRASIPARVIPNGADLSVFKPLEHVAAEPRLVYVGRAGDRVKNIDRLLDACARVRAQVPGFELWAAPGLGSSQAYVRDLGEQRGVALRDALSKCRALTLVSLYEGDPIVVHEAKAMGLPVLAADIPQLRDALSDYPNTIYVNPRSVDSISFGIKTVVLGAPPVPAPRPRSWDAVARDLVLFYAELRAKR